MEIDDLTEEDFKAYERIRSSGVTNMSAIGEVGELSGLSEEKIIAVRDHYNELVKKYHIEER